MNPSWKEEKLQLQAKVAELEARVAELQTALESKKKSNGSKAKQQAEQVLALLRLGPVTKAQLLEINPKYPSDPIYYCRSILGVKILTDRKTGTYTLVTEEEKKEDTGNGDPVSVPQPAVAA